jgi:hypothetical protein
LLLLLLASPSFVPLLSLAIAGLYTLGPLPSQGRSYRTQEDLGCPRELRHTRS